MLANLEQIDPRAAEDVEELAQWPERSAGTDDDRLPRRHPHHDGERGHTADPQERRRSGDDSYVYALSAGKRSRHCPVRDPFSLTRSKESPKSHRQRGHVSSPR